MKSLLKVILGLIIVSGVAVAAYFYRGQFPVVVESIKTTFNLWKPCERPLTYTIGSFDKRFGLSEKEFLNAISTAANTWESAIGRDLFEYEEGGEITVNLIYDYRQQVTDTLDVLDDEIKGDRVQYEAARSKYITLLAAYNRDKAALQSEISAYNAHKKEYEEKVAYWNERGGAPRQDYQRLERDRTELNAEMANLAQKTEALRNLADQVNETVNALNRMAREFNIQVNEYNEVGASVGKEFDEGEYVRDGNGTRITIYQFEDKGKLERVLIHELGHALGLEHVENPKAIMYRLNIGSNSRLAPEDLAGLKLVCEITS